MNTELAPQIMARMPRLRYSCIILFAMLLLGIVASAQPAFHVGAISFDVKRGDEGVPNGMRIRGKQFTMKLDWPTAGVGDYACVVRNPFATPGMEDGYVRGDTNFTVLNGVDDLKASAFARFVFYTWRPTTIGLLVGHAAANGHSTQDLFLADVETGACVVIPLADGQMPLWLDRTSQPPSFATLQRNGLMPTNQITTYATMQIAGVGLTGQAGNSLRINQAFQFSHGVYQHDINLEKRLLKSRFKQAQLTSIQRQRLTQVDIVEPMDLFFPEVNALCDFVYYGHRINAAKPLDRLIATLKTSLRESVQAFRRDLEYEVRNGLPSEPDLEENPAPVFQEPEYPKHLVAEGDTEVSIAKHWGVSIKDLEESNPGIAGKRLKRSQFMSIPIPRNPQTSASAAENLFAGRFVSQDVILVLKPNADKWSGTLNMRGHVSEVEAEIKDGELKGTFEGINFTAKLQTNGMILQLFGKGLKLWRLPGQKIEGEIQTNH